MAAFVVLQLGEIVLPAFDAPGWALQSVVVAAALGFPVALAFAWVYDLTSSGLERTKGIGRQGAGTRAPRIAMLVVTVASVAFAALWFRGTIISDGNVPAGADSDGGPGGDPAPSGTVIPGRGVLTAADMDPEAPVTAIAVLPLAYFADGDDMFARQLHEEIITHLTRITSLRVVSRTSVERYANTRLLLPRVAEELQVQAIVTGSVAAATEGNSVRISLQLLHAPTDTHLLTWTFHRELTDIFRVQAEIAREIAIAVEEEVAADDEGMERILEQIPPVDPEAYMAFMQGREEFGESADAGLADALASFSRSADIDPGFGQAYAWRAATQLLLLLQTGDSLSDPLDALRHIREDLSIADSLGGAEDKVNSVRVEMESHWDEVLALLPDSGGAEMEAYAALVESDSLVRDYVRIFTELGRRIADSPREGEAGRETILGRISAARRLTVEGMHDGAATLYRAVLSDEPANRAAWAGLEETLLLADDAAGALEARISGIYEISGDTPDNRRRVQEMRGAFDADDPARSYWAARQVDQLVRQASGEPVPYVEQAKTSVGLGEYDMGLRYLREAVRLREPGLISLTYARVWDPLRSTVSFREISREAAGLWRRPPALRIPGSLPSAGGEREGLR